MAIAEGAVTDIGDRLAWIAPARLWQPGRPATRHDWLPFTYRPSGTGFRPVDAAVMPPGGPLAGWLLVLERRYSPLRGLGIRLALVDPADIATGTAVIPHWSAPVGVRWPTDNYEGLAAHRDAAGRLILTLLSDDNFNDLLQRTLLVSLELAESVVPGRPN